MYKVVQTYDDKCNGNAQLSEVEEGNDLTPFKEFPKYDRYVDVFDTREEAEEFLKECEEA